MWGRNTADRDTPFWAGRSSHSNCLLSINVLITSLCVLLPSSSSTPLLYLVPPDSTLHYSHSFGSHTHTHPVFTHAAAPLEHACVHTHMAHTQTHDSISPVLSQGRRWCQTRNWPVICFVSCSCSVKDTTQVVNVCTYVQYQLKVWTRLLIQLNEEVVSKLLAGTVCASPCIPCINNWFITTIPYCSYLCDTINIECAL